MIRSKQQPALSLSLWKRARERADDARFPLTFLFKRLGDLQSRLKTQTRSHLSLVSPHPRRFSQEEKREFNWKLYAQLTVSLLVAITLKYFYSNASVNQLRWILAPVALAVEFVSGRRFEFEPYAGYIDTRHTFVIAASCAGVNFMITAFLMLALGKLWRERSQDTKWRFLPIAAAVAYVATLLANTVRITTAMQLRGTRLGGSLTAGQLHRLEGILVYFGFLLLLYVLSERASKKGLDVYHSSNLQPSEWILRRSLFPLLIYYATTLGLPTLNGAFRQPGFWEHSLFVLLIPPIFIIPFVGFSWLRRTLPYHPGFAHLLRVPTLVGHSLPANEGPIKDLPHSDPLIARAVKES